MARRKVWKFQLKIFSCRVDFKLGGAQIKKVFFCCEKQLLRASFFYCSQPVLAEKYPFLHIKLFDWGKPSECASNVAGR